MLHNEIWLLLLTVAPIVAAGLIGFAMLRRHEEDSAERRKHEAAMRRLRVSAASASRRD